MQRSREVEVSMHIMLNIQPIEVDELLIRVFGSRLIVAES